MFRGWLKNRNGATSIEYAMIASLIAAVLIVGLSSMATGTNSYYGRLNTAFERHIMPGQ